MRVVFTENGWEEFCYWIDHDPAQVRKIKELISSIRTSPFHGLGKPEPLKHQLKGYWSRRISHEHRLVYEISGKKNESQICKILQCRFHYRMT